ncbi:MAG: hypothetical protein B6242_15395 [Anaerolineaceae bacterium 4572_78]|nr:MAG: hypothetical protein B6242_15395 [Anaerolineaceae bacterium 4572_78]
MSEPTQIGGKVAFGDPEMQTVEDGLEPRWGLFLGIALFYFVATLAFAIFVSLYEYPDIAKAADNTEKTIRNIHAMAFRLRWLFYIFVAVASSPWVVTRTQNLKISRYHQDNESGNSGFLYAYFILVIVVGPLLAYLWQPIYLSLNWGEGIGNLFDFYTYLDGTSNLPRETMVHLPLIVVTTLLVFTLFRVVFGSHPARQDATQEIVLASGTLLTAVVLVVLVFSHDFSIVWTICALLSLPTTLLFVGTWSWWTDKKLGCYVPVLGLVFLVMGPGVLLFLARSEEYSVAWILAVIVVLAGVLLLITSAVVSRDATRVKEVIENNLQDPPDVKLPRVTLSLIKQTRANTAWAIVNIIVDTLSVIAITLVNSIARAGHFSINRVIMPSLETVLYVLLWLLTQLFNLLLIFFTHLVFALITLPDFLRKIATVVLESLEINLKYIYFQILTLLAVACATVISAYFAIDYLLTGKVGLILGIFGAGLVGIFSIVYSLSLLFKVSFFKAFNFYLRSLSELLSYCLLAVVVISWLLVGLGPRFGIEYFKPGLITWLSTAILVLALPLAYAFREKQDNRETTV